MSIKTIAERIVLVKNLMQTSLLFARLFESLPSRASIFPRSASDGPSFASSTARGLNAALGPYHVVEGISTANLNALEVFNCSSESQLRV